VVAWEISCQVFTSLLRVGFGLGKILTFGTPKAFATACAVSTVWETWLPWRTPPKFMPTWAAIAMP